MAKPLPPDPDQPRSQGNQTRETKPGKSPWERDWTQTGLPKTGYEPYVVNEVFYSPAITFLLHAVWSEILH